MEGRVEEGPSQGVEESAENTSKGMKRRDFLKTSAGAAAAVATSLALDRLGLGLFRGAKATHIPASPIPASKVVIIGAGLCGLVAAWQLSQKGKAVVVLENDDEPGGRVKDWHWPNGQVSHVCWEEFFDKTIDPKVNWLIDQLGLRSDVFEYSVHNASYIKGTYVQKTSYVQWIYGLNWGNPVLDPADHESMAYDYITKTIGDLAAPWQHPDSLGNLYASYDNETFDKFVLRQYNTSGDGDVNYVSNIFMTPEAGQPNNVVSKAYDFSNYFYWYNGKGYQLLHGNSQVITQLANRLPAGVLRLGAKVTSIANNKTGTGVTVNYVQGGKKFTETGDVAIVTVPHTLVPGIVPSLPRDRLAAINALGYSKVIRLNLQFGRKFWKDDLKFNGWGVYSDQTAIWMNNDTNNDNLATGALSPYICEPKASALWIPLTSDQQDDPHTDVTAQAGAIIDAVLTDIAKFWPQVKTTDPPIGVKVWEAPYYGPAYPPGYVASGMYELNQKLFGRIIFGGDWTYAFGTEGAVSRALDIVAYYIS